MNLSGLHLLLTYRCTYQCDHCFAWGSPWQRGVMDQPALRRIFRQAQDAGTITSIYFEGGEPFLYYATLLWAVREAAGLGFQTGIVSNAFWAASEEDALAALSPFAGLLGNLSISCDLFHTGEAGFQLARNAATAAQRLGIPVGTLSIAQPESKDVPGALGQIPPGESGVMFRGRAAERLAAQVEGRPWDSFSACPHENLREPGRVHLDPLGNLHLCQGLSMGNLFQTPLAEVCRTFDPTAHPITGPLIQGGPAELVRRYALPHADCYADACHLCYTARLALRPKFPEILTPDQMYGKYVGGDNLISR